MFELSCKIAPAKNLRFAGALGISTAAVSEVTSGQFNMLKWDKREYRYYPLEVDMYQKG